MKLCQKPKTDEEYVESIRRRLSLSRLDALMCAGLALLFFGLSWRFWRPIYSGADMQGDKTGFRVGIVFGLVAGVTLALSVNSIVAMLWSLKGNRTERLLVQFNDELKQYKDNLETEGVS